MLSFERRLIPSAAIALAAIFLLAAPATAQQGFTHPGIQKDAERYETYLRDTWKQSKAKPADLKLAADKLVPTDPRAAARNYAQAVAADPKDVPAWIGLARALLAVKPETTNSSERYDLPINASGAAYRAVERARDTTTRAEALRVLGEALERRSYWRPAIDALKASLTLADNSDTRQAYDRLRAEHGFRMTDYKTEADATEPRICAQFSERLAADKGDLAKFVALDGRDPQNVSAEGKQLCIEGLKHGTRYEIALRAGLPSESGDQLQKQVAIAAYVPDRKPFVRFSGRSYVLPSRGQQGIPVVAVNTSKAAIEIYRIGDRNLAAAIQNGDFQKQLSGYELENIRDRTGALVYKGELELPVKLNEETTTAFPVSDAVGTLKPGAYAMTARAAERTGGAEGDDALATQWFIVSDLGLTAFSGADGVHGFVRSLADTTPVAGATVRLIARNNEVLGEAKSDAKGYVRFAGGLGKGEGGLQPAILVAEHGTGEYAFLDLSTAAFDLSDRGVKGRDPAGALDAYLYTERGVYRPGEAVNITALMRDNAGKAATVPATLIVTRPDGVEHRRTGLADQGLGGRTELLELGDGAMTGTWRAKLHTDPKADPIAQVAFLVEDFVPERVELKIDVPKDTALAPEKTQAIKATGRYLYGPPAADLVLEADIVVKAGKDVEGFPGYKFGLADETINPVRKALEGLPKTGADGKADLPVTLPAIQKTAKPLVADLLVRLRESGGRTIERTVTMPVALSQPRIGIKPGFGAEGLEADANAQFAVLLLDAASKPAAAKDLAWELKRLETTWQWYSRDGHWTYEAVTLSRKVASGKLSTTADAPGRIDAKVGYGRYKLEVATAEADGPMSSVIFNAGWYANPEDADSPEALDVALDKPSYKTGDTAKLRIASKQGGKALVAILGSSLNATQEVDIPKGGGEVSIPVGDWGAGAYATALLYRPMDEKAKRMPSRAIGIKWLPLDQTARTLKLAIDTPAKVKSGASVKLPIKVSGLDAGEEARVTIAAVDQGILNLTRYEMPAPDRHFYAQRKLGIEIRDFYGRLIDGMRAERGKLRSGGDGAAGMSMTGSPPVEELVSYFSGILKVGADGTATAEMQLPDFNGQVRVMAVAWSADKLGHAGTDLIVRDAVALTASAPRFLTLGDEARLDVSVHNVEGAAGSYPVILEAVGGDKTERALDLKTGERKAERFALKPGDVGMKEYVARVTGPGGIDFKRKLTFEVVPPAGDIKRTTVSSLAAKGGKLTLSADLLADLIPSRTRINLSVGPYATLDVPGLLTQLDRYPYGCAEQTVSRALPLLYANSVASAIGIAPDKELKARVAGAIDHVLEMQDSSGAFGIWGPSNGDMWLTSYVTDFLTRAKELGYTVPPKAFAQALDKLQNHVAMAEGVKQGGEGRAYATYVLARNGRAPAGELRYYADSKLDAFPTPLAKAQLGAALAMQGDKERAEKLFRAALAQFDGKDKDVIARADYGSRLRDGAALVTLAAETGYVKSEAPRLVSVVAKAAQARTYTSTQEQAWMLLAAKALGDQAAATMLSVNGKRVTGSLVRAITPAELKSGAVTIVNDGDDAVDAVISVVGSALTPEPAVSKGLKIERSYYTLDGKKVDLKSATGGTSELKQNDRLVTVLKIEAKETGGRLLLVDRLASGLEIENPRLVDSGDIKTLDWLKTTVRPEHTEFRDDRFVAAFNFFGGNTQRTEGRTIDDDGEAEGDDEEAPANGAAKQVTSPVTSATVAYIVRAVTPGSFVHGAATVEDMYRPERHARTPAGRLTVKE